MSTASPHRFIDFDRHSRWAKLSWCNLDFHALFVVPSLAASSEQEKDMIVNRMLASIVDSRSSDELSFEDIVLRSRVSSEIVSRVDLGLVDWSTMGGFVFPEACVFKMEVGLDHHKNGLDAFHPNPPFLST